MCWRIFCVVRLVFEGRRYGAAWMRDVKLAVGRGSMTDLFGRCFVLSSCVVT